MAAHGAVVLDHVYRWLKRGGVLILVIPTTTSAIAARYWHINPRRPSTASPNRQREVQTDRCNGSGDSPGPKGMTPDANHSSPHMVRVPREGPRETFATALRA